jgi:hypothetical protein
MGDHVRVSYTDGPLSDKIEKVIGKYQYGHFNGMEDIYEYSNNRNDIPQTKYLFIERDISETTRAKIVDKLKIWYDNFDPELWIKGPDCWGSTLIHREFYKMSF